MVSALCSQLVFETTICVVSLNIALAIQRFTFVLLAICKQKMGKLRETVLLANQLVDLFDCVSSIIVGDLVCQ